MRSVKICLALVLLAVAFPVQAGSLTAELSRTRSEVGQPVILTVAIEGSADGDLQMPQVPGLAFEKNGVSQRTFINNGRMSRELHMTYLVYADAEGIYRIPSLSLTIDGKQESTLPLDVTFVADSGSGGTAQRPLPGGSLQGQASPKGQGSQKPSGTDGVFVEKTCDKTDPYVGEQVVCTIRVYHRNNLRGGQRLHQPSADIRRFGAEGERHGTRIIDGKRYNVVEMTEVVVPTRAGEVEVPPYVLNARVLTYNRKQLPWDNFFDNLGGGVLNFDFSFAEEKEVEVESNGVELKVKPLPDEKRPADFIGAVGSFQLTADVDQGHIKEGETVTVTLRVSGEGVLDQIPELDLGLDSNFKTYADKPLYQEVVHQGQGLHSSKTFKYALVPKKEGTYELGTIEFSVFNPKLEQFVTLRADLGPLVVEPGEAEQSLVVDSHKQSPASRKEVVKSLGDDLIGLHREPDLLASHDLSTTDVIWMTTVGSLPLGLAFVAFGFTEIRDRRRRSPAKRSPMRAFRNLAAEARCQLQDHQIEAGLTSVSRAFRVYLGERHGEDGKAYALGEVEERLLRLEARDEHKQEALAIMGRLEEVEFGGSVLDQRGALHLLERLEAIVGDLEQS